MTAQDESSTQIYETLKRQILVAVRGNRSKSQVSKALGYDFNQVYRWESGRTKCLWSHFVDLCQVCEADIDWPLFELFFFRGEKRSSRDLVAHLIGNTSISSAARISGISRHKLERWQLEKSEPTLDDILNLCDKLHGTAVDFCGHFVGSATADVCPKRVSEKTVIAMHPNAAIADILLELPEYRESPSHIEGFLAKKLQISLQEEKSLLRCMLEGGFIRFVDGKYHPNASKKINTRPNSFDEHALMITHWIELFLLALQRQRPLGFESKLTSAGYRVTFAGKETIEKIKKLHTEFYNDVACTLRDSSEDPTELYILQTQFFQPVPGVSVEEKSPPKTD